MVLKHLAKASCYHEQQSAFGCLLLIAVQTILPSARQPLAVGLPFDGSTTKTLAEKLAVGGETNNSVPFAKASCAVKKESFPRTPFKERSRSGAALSSSLAPARNSKLLLAVRFQQAESSLKLRGTFLKRKFPYANSS